MILQPVVAPFLAILLVLPVLAAAVWMLVRSLRRAPAAEPPSRTPVPERAKRDEGRTGAGPVVWALRVLLVLACGILLLRPGIPGGQVRTLASATDVVIAIDTTASMVAEDWDGAKSGSADRTRMAGVRSDVRRIAEAYPGARFALITFDANAVLRLPLTTDTGALVSAVDVLQPEVTRQSKGSSIGIANQLLAQTLQNARKASPDRARMVFYLGDGEQTVSSSPESFAAAKKLVSGGEVLGYGTAKGGPMRETTGAFEGQGDYIQYQGSDALSRIDEKNLQQIAGELGVGYEHRTAEAKPQLPPAPKSTLAYREDDPLTQPTDLSWIFALVIVALLCAEITRATILIMRMRHLSAPERPAAHTAVPERAQRDEGRPAASGGGA
ncbi:von Willebrand factor type A domain protein [Microbacterium sp. 8M]|uniref:vWA domain-containing protein n=1 Tax=Microbacterium sp. 8M TaxID=2653153 RepID=UPI0012F0A605|nr:VWA domain-containing protein [Microbacterium sp. 8M]VXB82656.1 von Willebrand factor type A domain protein [Microbacterium sp. 8M]